MIKLQQGQLWRAGDQYLRIVRLERLSVEYKLSDSSLRDGVHQQVSKKEFCRLIKQAELETAPADAKPPED